MVRRTSTTIEFGGAGTYWKIDIEEHAEDFYMVCFEEYENLGYESFTRTKCTEQLFDVEDLKELRDAINYVVSETS